MLPVKSDDSSPLTSCVLKRYGFSWSTRVGQKYSAAPTLATIASAPTRSSFRVAAGAGAIPFRIGSDVSVLPSSRACLSSSQPCKPYCREYSSRSSSPWSLVRAVPPARAPVLAYGSVHAPPPRRSVPPHRTVHC